MLQLQYEALLERFKDETSKEKSVHHCCIRCGKESFNHLQNRCSDCGGAMDAIYNVSRVHLADTYNPLERYFDLLPVQKKENLRWLGEGNTPCTHATRLGKHLGLSNLYLKDETFNPSRSTKDRIASVGLSRFLELGVKRFAIASTGNSSTAYARAVQMVDGFEVDIFVSHDFVDRLNYADHPRIHTYVLYDDFVGAGGAAKSYSQALGSFFEGGFFSLSRREGLKLSYLEAFDQMPKTPNYVFQAVSSGMGLLGAYKGAIEYKAIGRLTQLPSFVAVQQESCSPMANAFAEGWQQIEPHHIIKNPSGIAAAILRGDPTQSYPYIHSVCTSTGGQISAASEAEIRGAQALLFELEGIRACFASSTALAGMIKMHEQGLLPKNDFILVNLTGGDRPFAPVPNQFHSVKNQPISVSTQSGSPRKPVLTPIAAWR